MIEIRTPTRLHFGFLAFGTPGEREFGGPGLMIKQPDVVLRLSIANESTAVVGRGPLADKAQAVAVRFLEAAMERGLIEHRQGVTIDVQSVPRPHTGLGSGTQIAMAVARGLCRLLHIQEPELADLATMVGRGRRSAIGVHGFDRGGFLLEGGKVNRQGLSPLLMHRNFPENWRVIVIRPRALEGLAGEREHKAFGEMPAMPQQVTDELCRLVLLGMCPALVEEDIDGFGDALYEMQQIVGKCFAHAQGGIYAAPLLDRIVAHIRRHGVRGVGQSSWGPTLYAVTPSAEAAKALADDIRQAFDLRQRGEVLVTQADNTGSQIRVPSTDRLPDIAGSEKA